jgi:hypothetical protein
MEEIKKDLRDARDIEGVPSISEEEADLRRKAFNDCLDRRAANDAAHEKFCMAAIEKEKARQAATAEAPLSAAVTEETKQVIKGMDRLVAELFMIGGELRAQADWLAGVADLLRRVATK